MVRVQGFRAFLFLGVGFEVNGVRVSVGSHRALWGPRFLLVGSRPDTLKPLNPKPLHGQKTPLIIRMLP